MIWSDSELTCAGLWSDAAPFTDSCFSAVLFCLPAKNNQLSGYYDPNSVVTAELADSIPEGIDTVFWEQVAFLSGYPLRASLRLENASR